jgi:hypothetical protein
MEAADANGLEGSEDYLGVVIEKDGTLNLLSGLGRREGSPDDAPKSVPLEVGQWQQVVLTFDEQKVVCYVDGKEKGSRETKTLLARLSDPACKLGRAVKAGRLFRGLLSDVRIYRKALSPDEVRAFMKEGDAGAAGK